MASKSPVFDDPTYIPANEWSDRSYDSPPSFLDHVPHYTQPDSNETPPALEYTQSETNESPAAQPDPVDETKQPSTEHPEHSAASERTINPKEDSGDYTIVDDFLLEEGEEDLEEGEDEEDDYEGEVQEGTRLRRVRQSFTDKEEEGRGERIYISGGIVHHQPPLSFKSRVRSQSKEEIEKEGIYQGLLITNEQKQNIGIMPESIYMTVVLQSWGNKLEDMSMELQLNDNKPVMPQQSVTPRYRGCILYPPPLPPLNQGAPTTQRKCHAIVENLLKSEAAFLTSLKIADQVYLKPLQQMSSPPIDRDQVRVLFGSMVEVMAHHELFYTALTTRTMDWGPKQTIGNIFMTFYRKEVIGHYVEYVNNFTDAMETLQKCIKRRPKFVTFLKTKYAESKTSLSLQGLLLKPIQRFPQYILFLQDLIKYTPPHHADRVTLQLALARCETIAEHLNEAKRAKEQQIIVAHLSSRVTGLPFRLTDSPNRCLQTQEPVTRLMLSPQGSDNVVERKRSLLLFNNMVLCASMKKSSSSASCEVGVYDDAYYKCKWQCPLDKLIVTEPDYTNDIWDYIVREDESEEAVAYERLKSQYMRYTKDFMTMSKIASLISCLSDTYIGLTLASVQNHLRVLQRKIAKSKEQLKRRQPGRLDIQIPSRDWSKMIHHTYVFESEKAKQNWLNSLRCASLKLKEENKEAWVHAENAEDDDMVLDCNGQLPLFVEHYHLTNNSEALSTECATRTLTNQVWVVSCSSTTAEVAIIQCVTPRPIMLKSFTVDSSRILSICYAPWEALGTESTPRQSSALFKSPSYSTLMDTVWMGSQDGKLMIHSASSEVAHKCMEVIVFSDTITCMEYYNNQVFIAVEGNLYIYQRPKESEWDLDNPVVMKVHSEGPITCMCQVEQKLWIGARNLCYVLNMNTLKLEGYFQVNRDPGTTVRRMASSGSGVWMCFRRSATVQLFHTVTKAMLQEIDIEKAFLNIISKHDLQNKMNTLSNVHITSLLLCQGYLWIGMSSGIVMVYRTPYLKTVPIVTGKPYMAMYGHNSGVRVIISTYTVGTLSSSRVNQFISEEQERKFQEDWEASEVCHENPVPTTDEPDEMANDTLPPLPPPVFTDETTPTGTLTTKDQQAPLTIEEVPDLSSKENDDETGTLTRCENGDNDVTEIDSSAANATEEVPQYTSGGVSLPVRTRSTKINRLPRRERRESEVEFEKSGTFHRISTPESEDVGTFRPILSQDANKNGGSSPHLTPPDVEEDGERVHPKSTPEPTGHFSSLYEEVAADESPVPIRNRSPSLYEDPATLLDPNPFRPMPDLFSTLGQSTIPKYASEQVEGAVYVLTGGRGVVNLRPGTRRSVHYIALHGSDVSTANESCIVAYELKY